MAPPWIEPRTAYLHVPFCAHHCGYCDFAVSAGQDHLIELYLDALAMELATLGEPRPVESLFIGGGTPTYLTAKQLQRLLEMIGIWLPLDAASPEYSGWHRASSRCSTGKDAGAPPEYSGWHRASSRCSTGKDAGAPPEYSGWHRASSRCSTGKDAGAPPEYSIESTPDSLTEEKAALLAAFGVNRVSIGVQSFRPDLLAALDRRHTTEQIPRAVDAVRRHIPALSFDLIFAAPRSTLDTWSADLDAALAFDPQHISTYGLTYEKGTPIWKQRQRGLLDPIDEDGELAMYEFAIDRLARAGFEHYEISNFARPGQRCRHNEHYWANEAYYGFGVGAARYANGIRELNTRDTNTYIRKVLSGESPTFQSECLGAQDRAFETIGTQLRRAEGIDRGRFHEQTGLSLDDLVGVRVGHLVGAGILLDDGAGVRLTHRGKCVADAAIEDLMKSNDGSAA